MKTQNESFGTYIGTIRPGVISLFVLALCYLWMTGISDLLRVWLFIVSFAVCLVLMMQSIVDLLVLAFGFAMRFVGAGVGRSARAVRRFFSRAQTTA